MDILQKATIAGKAHGLMFYRAEIKQALFEHCHIELELGFGRHESDVIIKTAVSDWLGEILELTIYDRVEISTEKKYKGTITEMSSTTSSIILKAVSEDLLLSAAQKHRAFVDTDVIGIVRLLINDAGVANQNIYPPPQSTKFKFFQQYDETDYNCLMRLAQFDGCVFYHDGEDFTYSPTTETKDSISLGLEAIKDIHLNCKLERTKWLGMPYDYTRHSAPADSKYNSVPLSPDGHPYSKETYNHSKKVFSKITEHNYNKTITVKQDYEKFLGHRQKYSSGKMIEVTGVTINPLVAIGRAISCPEHTILKSPVTVTSMKAVFKDQVYEAEFTAIASDSIVQPPADENLRTILEPAIVTDNVDPEALGRVQVQYLWDLDGVAQPWARMSQAGAGSTANGVGYGTHFTPRIGDHVLVACEHGNASLPIVLGALYHSEHKPDFKTDNGTEEVLVVKTPQESVIRVLDTDGSEEIIIHQRDNKNIIRLELAEPKITIESDGGIIDIHSKTINITADEGLNIKAKDIVIEAVNDLDETIGNNLTTNVSSSRKTTVGTSDSEDIGTNKEITAGANLKMEASAKAEIKASAQLSLNSAMIESKASATNIIKGGTVMIN